MNFINNDNRSFIVSQVDNDNNKKLKIPWNQKNYKNQIKILNNQKKKDHENTYDPYEAYQKSRNLSVNPQPKNLEYYYIHIDSKEREKIPKIEAENVLLDKSMKIIKIKKNIEINENVGEFIGIIKLSKKGSKIFVKKYDKLINSHVGNFHEAPNILKGYITDMIQELVDSKEDIEPVLITGKWCEIDTIQDLKKAEEIF